VVEGEAAVEGEGEVKAEAEALGEALARGVVEGEVTALGDALGEALARGVVEGEGEALGEGEMLGEGEGTGEGIGPGTPTVQLVKVRGGAVVRGPGATADRMERIPSRIGFWPAAEGVVPPTATPPLEVVPVRAKGEVAISLGVQNGTKELLWVAMASIAYITGPLGIM